MRKEFLIERQGKSMVLYAGLLDLAHQQGLVSIRTELLQLPNEGTGYVALVQATATFVREGREYVFQGIGDAMPQNVAPAMQHCLIRMSETRAKARALRDAVNVGVVAFEEMSEEEGDSVRVPRSVPTAPRRPAAVVDQSAPASEAQCEAIRKMCGRHGIEPPDFETLTQGQASAKIKELQGGVKG